MTDSYLHERMYWVAKEQAEDDAVRVSLGFAVAVVVACSLLLWTLIIGTVLLIIRWVS